MLSVSPCTSGLLIIRLNGFWQIVMNDIPYIWLIDTHTERDRCTDNVYIVMNEFILDFLPHLI